MPGTPSARNAERQPYACATAPAMSAASHAPNGAPSAKIDSAMGRRSAGKQSDTIEVDGGVAPASPTPTPMRAITNCKVVWDMPHSIVKPDHSTRDAATMLRRFERSASHATGMPKAT